MQNFKFQEIKNDIKNRSTEALNLLGKKDIPEIITLKNDFERFLQNYNNESKLNIAFIGQYDAGKSSLIAAITNAKFIKSYEEETDNETKFVNLYKIGNKNIKISSQIMTDSIESYEWNDVLIVDTPGIYAGRTDHDKKTFDTISKADLLIFVISNESFNQQGGDFFRKLSKELKRDEQILLVVNKMSRESGERQSLVGTINKVLEPKKVEDYYTSFIDAKDYLEAINEEDEEEKEYLINKSHFNDFITSIDTFIKEKGLIGKISTPLYMIQDTFKRIQIILDLSNIKAKKDLIEISRRRKLLFKSFKIQLENSLLIELNELTHKIKILGEEIVDLIDGNHSNDDIEKKVSEVESKISNLLSIYENKSKKIIEEHKQEIKNKCEDELEKSIVFKSFCNEVVTELESYSKSIDIKINIDIDEFKKSTFDKDKLDQLIGSVQKTALELIEVNQKQISERADLYQEAACKLTAIASIGATAALLVANPADPSLFLQAAPAIVNTKRLLGSGNESSTSLVPYTSVMKGGGELTKVAKQGVTELIVMEQNRIAEIIKNRTIWEKAASMFGKGKEISSNIHLLQKSLPIISGVGAILSIGGTIWEEKKTIDLEIRLAKYRSEIRENMQSVSKDIDENYKKDIKENVLNIYDQEITMIEDEESKFKIDENSVKEYLSTINLFLKKVSSDIDKINKLV